MPVELSRRSIVRASGVAIVLGTTGCLRSSPNEGSMDSTTDSTQTDAQGTTSTQTPVSGPVISTEEAKERALTAEKEYLTEQFTSATCVEDWGLESYTGFEKKATVTNVTQEEVEVEVSYPYWYSTEQDEADSGSISRYLVTTESTTRVDGDNVSPC